MEILKKILPLATALLLASCEYLGFAGYINQLDEIGITHELADAVSFDQHMTSRPREFQGKVYVLGTRGVFAMKADKLTDYEFYPYAQDLGYESDYWSDSLPPINCYRDPSDGRIVISGQNHDRGLLYGDTLKLYEGAKRAELSPGNWSGSFVPTVFLKDSGSNIYMFLMDVDNYWNQSSNIDLDDSTGAYITTYTTNTSEYAIPTSFTSWNSSLEVLMVTQWGVSVPGTFPATLQIYSLSTDGTTINSTSLNTLNIDEDIRHDTMAGSSPYYYISEELQASVNGRYLLVWGDSLDDGNTMAIYDYTTGERRVKTDVPGNRMFPELGEDGMTVYASSIRGGVARYDYD